MRFCSVPGAGYSVSLKTAWAKFEFEERRNSYNTDQPPNPGPAPEPPDTLLEEENNAIFCGYYHMRRQRYGNNMALDPRCE